MDASMGTRILNHGERFDFKAGMELAQSGYPVQDHFVDAMKAGWYFWSYVMGDGTAMHRRSYNILSEGISVEKYRVRRNVVENWDQDDGFEVA